MEEKKQRQKTKDKTVLYVSAAIALVFVLLSMLFTEATNEVFNQLFALITNLVLAGFICWQWVSLLFLPSVW